MKMPMYWLKGTPKRLRSTRTTNNPPPSVANTAPVAPTGSSEMIRKNSRMAAKRSRMLSSGDSTDSG